ncbi:MAG: HNH endonuclease [Fimbriimonadaceae bacterium]|nr:HNH endonuclease [Fimbriimonadaceae bacterium]
MPDSVDVLCSVCAILVDGDLGSARTQLARDYPVAQSFTRRSNWSLRRQLAVFMRDGFIDRYTGRRLVFPGTLRALSVLMPEEFPFHPNWKQSEAHPAFWDLSATIDHVVPVARGGADDESNVVTTSMVRNAAKANWLLNELGWPARRETVSGSWDGLIGWFHATYEASEQLKASPSLQRWYRASRR